MTPKFAKVTRAEVAVWKDLANTGDTLKGIAGRLKRSPKTIDCQLRQLRRKLNCHSNRELIVLAWKRGIVTREEELLQQLRALVSTAHALLEVPPNL